jgi:hypothetical protein
VKAVIKVTQLERPNKGADPIDTLTTAQFDALLDSMSGRPVRRRSRRPVRLDPTGVLAHVGQRLAAYPDAAIAA